MTDVEIEHTSVPRDSPHDRAPRSSEDHEATPRKAGAALREGDVTRYGTPLRPQGFERMHDKLRALLDDIGRHDSLFWRRAIDAGVTHGPKGFVRWSPPVFGLIFGALLTKHREAVIRNLRRALGRRSALEEYTDVARLFTSYANCLTEAFIAGTERDRLVAHHVTNHHYAAAVAEGRGVIVATAHTGGWQAAGPLMRSVRQADVLVVMQRERDVGAQRLQDEARDRAGIKVVHVGQSPLDALPLLAHLKKKGVIAVQIDRLPKGMRSREVTLFGEPWLVPEGPLLLAALSGAPIIPTFTRRLRYMEYEVLTTDPIRLARKPTAAQLDAAAQRLTSDMETFVRANPTQWFHFE